MHVSLALSLRITAPEPLEGVQLIAHLCCSVTWAPPAFTPGSIPGRA
jgi:hypothetical protein